VHELLAATSVPLSCHQLFTARDQSQFEIEERVAGCSVCALTHPSRNDIVAVKIKLDEKHRERFVPELGDV
jgi:hypothetical protein